MAGAPLPWAASSKVMKRAARSVVKTVLPKIFGIRVDRYASPAATGQTSMSLHTLGVSHM